jgi:hypothetical protein
MHHGKEEETHYSDYTATHKPLPLICFDLYRETGIKEEETHYSDYTGTSNPLSP